MELGRAPLSEVLDKTLAQAGGNKAKLNYNVREGVIEISTGDDVNPRPR
jgi:hypothetical protein